MKISLIAAIGKNRELGKDNKLLWRIPADLARFKKITQGHTVIMGRKTYASIGHPLPQRTNIIITRNSELNIPNCIVVNSLEAALNKARNLKETEVFVIGGGQIYAQALPQADKLYLTLVDRSSPADTFFPEYAKYFTKKVFKEKHQSADYSYTFLELEK